MQCLVGVRQTHGAGSVPQRQDGNKGGLGTFKGDRGLEAEGALAC